MNRRLNRIVLLTVGLVVVGNALDLIQAQEKSVRPGVNDAFKDPSVEDFVGRFEIESREIFAHRKEILAACNIKPGMAVADVGAGTGLFTRMIAESVGKEGTVVAVDIARKFLEHIASTCRQKGLNNVQTILCKPDSSELPPNSVDVVFICDTYHHFEFPVKTMKTIHVALKDSGRLFVIDFHRIEGKSSDWTLNHVRAGQDVFIQEIESAGFKKSRDRTDILKENYFLEFAKSDVGNP